MHLEYRIVEFLERSEGRFDRVLGDITAVPRSSERSGEYLDLITSEIFPTFESKVWDRTHR